MTKNDDPLDDDVNESEAILTVITYNKLSKYRKNRPLKKLHNVGMAIRHSSQLPETFLRAQVSPHYSQMLHRRLTGASQAPHGRFTKE